MKTLFICKGNMFRSQMAAALYNKLTNTTDAFSVGTYTGAPEEPEGQALEDLPKQGLLNSYCFDEVEGLGKFVELEQITSEDPKEVQKEMVEFLAAQGLNVEERVVNGYDTLMYKKINNC